MTLLETVAAFGGFVALALPLGGAGYLHEAWSKARRSLGRSKSRFAAASRTRRAWRQRVGTSGFIV